MTSEDIDKMEAGREMDVLILERIFHKTANPGSLSNPTLRLYDDPLNSPTMCSNTPFFSESIAAAWNVVEKLHTIHISDIHIHWGAINREYTCFISMNFPDESLTIFASSPSPALAICRAALKVVMK